VLVSASMNRMVYGLCALLAAAASLYFYRVGALSLTTDEIYHAISARSILEGGLPVLPNDKLYIKGLPFSYVGAALAALCGSIETGVRVASGLGALLGGAVLFKLVSRLVDERAGLLASTLFLFHPWTIELARWGRLYVVASALLTLSTLYWLRYDESRARRDALLASGWLLAAMVSYPFSVWGAVAIGACWVVEHLNTHPKRAVPVLIGLLVCGAAAAGVVFAINLYPEVLIPIIGFHSKLSFEDLTGFSAHYGLFYLRELFVFSACVLMLLAQTLPTLATGPSSPQPQRARRVGLIVLTLGGVGLITFVHLQPEAYRYLFPIFPVTIAAALLPLSDRVARLPSNRASGVYASLGVLAFLAYGAYGAYGIPFKQHGDPYLNSHFGPSPKRTHYTNYRRPAQYIAEHAQPRDLVISDAAQFFYYYAAREADYALQLDRSWPKGEPFYYMKSTVVLTRTKELHDVLAAARAGQRSVWITINGADNEKKIAKLVKKHRLARVFRDGHDRSAVVYATPALHSEL
jgi:hypothetical protein